MDCFVKRFQPDRYEAWLAGDDLGHHPEDDPRLVAPSIAPPPTAQEYMENRTNMEHGETVVPDPRIQMAYPTPDPMHAYMYSYATQHVHEQRVTVIEGVMVERCS